MNLNPNRVPNANANGQYQTRVMQEMDSSAGFKYIVFDQGWAIGFFPTLELATLFMNAFIAEKQKPDHQHAFYRDDMYDMYGNTNRFVCICGEQRPQKP